VGLGRKEERGDECPGATGEFKSRQTVNKTQSAVKGTVPGGRRGKRTLDKKKKTTKKEKKKKKNNKLIVGNRYLPWKRGNCTKKEQEKANWLPNDQTVTFFGKNY